MFLYCVFNSFNLSCARRQHAHTQEDRVYLESTIVKNVLQAIQLDVKKLVTALGLVDNEVGPSLLSESSCWSSPARTTPTYSTTSCNGSPTSTAVNMDHLDVEGKRKRSRYTLEEDGFNENVKYVSAETECDAKIHVCEPSSLIAYSPALGLAQFVAATISEKACVDLIEENNKLRHDLQKTKLVKVTGPGGFPIYAKGYLPEFPGNHRSHSVKLRNATGEDADPTLVKCQLKDVEDAEIRVNEMPIYILSRFDRRSNTTGKDDVYCEYVYTFQQVPGGEDLDGNGIDDLSFLCLKFGPYSADNVEVTEDDGPRGYSNEEIDEVLFASIDFNNFEK